jgi:hypothetical protein
MGYWTVVVMVLGAGLLAALFAVVARRLIPLAALRSHHEVAGAVFLQLGVIFAVLLAFVFNGVRTGYSVAAQAVNQECGSLHGVAILADTLPPPGRTAVLEGVRAYLTAVIDREWRGMADGHISATAAERFRAAWTAVARVAPAGPGVGSVRREMLAEMATAHQSRETRLFQMTRALPGLIWVMLIAFTVLLTGFLFAFAVENLWSQVVFAAVFAAGLALVLVIIRLLDLPFQGALRLPPTDFIRTLHEVVQLQAAPRPPP